MRNIGRLDDVAQARTFSDLLVAQGIANDVRPTDGAQVVWVHDDARLDEARTLLADFRANPADPRFKAVAATGKARRKEAQKADEAYRNRVKLAQQSLYGADGRGWVTLTLLAVSAVVAAVSNLGSNVQLLEPLFLTWEPASAGLPEVRSGEVWRLFTPIVVHFGIFHLGFNASMWWTWGQKVEVRKGLRFFLPLVLASAVVSNLVEFAWQSVSDPLGIHLAGGLSGVLYALFGYAWTKGRIDPQDELEVPDSTVTTMIGWLFLCMTGILGPIANGAHVGGLLFGIAWAYGDRAWFRWRKGR